MPASATKRSASIRSHHVGDGLVVRLSGVLDGQTIPALRRELLGPLPDGCRDVLIDAGAVEALDDAVTAVLVAGAHWAILTGRRFALCAVSQPVADQIETLDLWAELPVLDPAR
jgi:anti-anti-sigma factor